MNLEMKIIREINIQAEKFYEDAIKLGDHAAYALKGLHRSQMTSLETITESTLKTTDIFDYVKKQTARFAYWRQGFPEYENPSQGFGERLKNYLEEELSKKRSDVCKIVGISNSDIWKYQEVYLMLIRQFIRQLVVQYEYRVSLMKEEKL